MWCIHLVCGALTGKLCYHAQLQVLVLRPRSPPRDVSPPHTTSSGVVVAGDEHLGYCTQSPDTPAHHTYSW